MKQLLIIGAGPYGLALAAYAKDHGLDFLLIGKPMEFRRRHMPRGMSLRSGADWHLDPLAIHTFNAYLAEKNLNAEQVNPIPVAVFQEYAQWFQKKYNLQPQPDFVRWLGAAQLGGPKFLSKQNVQRIANRSDEHYRRRILNV